MLEILYESKASCEAAFDLINDFKLEEKEVNKLKKYWDKLEKISE